MKYNKIYVDDKLTYLTFTSVYILFLALYTFFEHHIGFIIFPFLVFSVSLVWSLFTMIGDKAYISDDFPSKVSVITTVPFFIRAMVLCTIAFLWICNGFLLIGIFSFISQSWLMFLYAAKMKYHKEMGWYNGVDKL